MEFITETILIVLLIVLAIFLIPLLIGMGIAALMEAAGLQFYSVTFIIAFAFWIIFGLGYFIWS